MKNTAKLPLILWPDFMDLITRAHCLAALDEYDSFGAIQLDENYEWFTLWDMQGNDIWQEENQFGNTAVGEFGDSAYIGLLREDEDFPQYDLTRFLRDGLAPGTIIIFAVKLLPYRTETEYGYEYDMDFNSKVIKIIQPDNLDDQILSLCQEYGVLLAEPVQGKDV